MSIEKGKTYSLKDGGTKVKAKVVSVSPKGRGHTVRYTVAGVEHTASLRDFESRVA